MNRLLISSGLGLFAAATFLSLSAQSPQAPPLSSHEAAGAKTFSTNCAGCHGADGRGGERAPNIATSRNIIALSDDDLEGIVKKGVPGTGMPSFSYLGDQPVKDVLAYLRRLQGKTSMVKVTGDASAGHDLFFGRAECSQCHMIKGEGGYIGSDLTDYAAGAAPDAVKLAITNPDDSLTPTSTVVELQLSNGEHISGMARAEDNFHITVQTKDGRWRTFDKSKLADLKHTGRSPHPRDYETKLSAKELDDLVSYLTVSAANAPAKGGRRRGQ
ncbi:MAG TPA: c-type cytochrome [Edaphobacter sp.]